MGPTDDLPFELPDPVEATAVKTATGFTPDSVRALESRAIPADLAEHFGIRPVLREEEMPNGLGWAWDGPGMVIEWRDHGRTVPQYRPDNPSRVYTDADGKAEKGPRKYLFPKGCGSPWNRLRGPSENGPVLIVEGALKGPAVAAWAPAGFGVTAIIGADNWRGADLSWTQGRDIFMAFDADTESNARVWAAAKELGDAIAEAQTVRIGGITVERKGTAQFIRLPQNTKAGAKAGIDDVLAMTRPADRTALIMSLATSATVTPGLKPLSKSEQDRIYPDARNPTRLAARIVEDFSVDGKTTLISFEGVWYRWLGPVWHEMSSEAVDAMLYSHLEDKLVHVHKNGQPQYKDDGSALLVPWNPNSRSINELTRALKARTGHGRGDEVPSSVWLDGRDDTDQYMSFANGLLNLRTRELVPHTVDFFNQVSVPYDYNPTAPAPVEWLKFLDSIWGDDADAVTLLQEWFAYVLSGRTDLQKFLLFLGPRRSGKGTLMRILEMLMGSRNYTGFSMSTFATNFGAQNMIGKMVAVAGDARLDLRDRTAALEKILTITGEDRITLDRKYAKPWNGRLSARLIVLSNKVLDLPDESGALAARTLTLTTRISFEGREDRGIEGRCKDELSGILLWVLEGMDRLTRNGYFTRPASSAEAEKVAQAAAAPVTSFLADWCETGDGDAFVLKSDLYDAFKAWCEAEGIEHVMTLPRFAAALFETGSGVKAQRTRINGQQKQTFRGVSMTARLVPGTGWVGPDTDDDEPEPDPVDSSDVDLWEGEDVPRLDASAPAVTPSTTVPVTGSTEVVAGPETATQDDGDDDPFRNDPWAL